MTAARLAAVRVLLALERQQTTLAAELERARHLTTDDRDRALVLELSAGTLRWQNELDAVIAACSRRGVADLGAQVRAVLRLGAYQLRHLDRVPAHAVVHESVELIKGLGQSRAAGFVNAVLRAITRRGANLRLPARPDASASRGEAARYLSTTLSHPAWLVTRWLDRYGLDAAAAWCEFNNRAPEMTVRVVGDAAHVLDRLHAVGVDVTPAPWVSHAYRIPQGTWSRVPQELRASLVIQDEASQIVALTAAARPGERVLDACAAPGGKTLIMAHAMEGRGQLVAADHRANRMRLLATAVKRETAAAALVQIDVTRPLPFGPVFDRVLLDAPCSGLGVVRRDPDIKWSRTEVDLAGFAVRQQTMLGVVADALRPGGTLVYATCSSEPDENERVVDAFLASRSDIVLAPADPGPDVRNGADLVDKRGMLRTLPFRHGMDAYFCAVLVRRRAA